MARKQTPSKPLASTLRGEQWTDDEGNVCERIVGETREGKTVVVFAYSDSVEHDIAHAIRAGYAIAGE